MSTERKLLIASGMTIIGGMIAIAFFALGVYVGEQGWTLSRPSPVGPAPPPAHPGVPRDRGGPAALPRAATESPLIGVVRRVEHSSLALQVGRETRTVALDGRTRYERRTAEGRVEEVTRESLSAGTPVAIFIRDGPSPVAERVLLLPRR